MIGKRLADAEAVTARGIDIHGGRYLVGIQFLVVVQAVGGWHGTVVVSQGEEGTRGVLGDVLLVAVFVNQLTLRVLAQQIVA